jgi:hypothetical protein
MRLAVFLVCSGTLLGILTGRVNATVIHVSNFEQLSTAIADATSGDTIDVTAGTYGSATDMLPYINVSMTIQQDPASAGSVILDSAPTGQKGILTVENAGTSLTVNGLTFENATIADSAGGNGAGIRDQSSGATTLTVENSFFLGNQDGILTDQNPFETIQVTNSIFENNGNDGGPGDPYHVKGREHALYVGADLSLTVSGSTFCGTIAGHDIKSRAQSTTVENSQIYDGAPDIALGCPAGSTSYGIDAPNGGKVVIDNNQIIQGAATENDAMVSYGEEGLTFADNSFLVSNTNFINSGVTATGIQELQNGIPTCLVPVQLSNDTFTGVATPVSPAGCSVNAPIPEPPSLWLLLAALGGFAAFCAKASVLRGRNLPA